MSWKDCDCGMARIRAEIERCSTCEIAAHKDEQITALTRELDEARAEVKRLRAALAKAKGEVDEIGELLDAANVPDHFVPWDEADASDRMSVQERVKALIEERDDACADAARLRRALAGEQIASALESRIAIRSEGGRDA